VENTSPLFAIEPLAKIREDTGMESIMFFSHQGNPEMLLHLLKENMPDMKFSGGDPSGEWQVHLPFKQKTGLLKKKLNLRVNHDPEYYAGPNWGKQQTGMIGYLSQSEAVREHADYEKIQQMILGTNFAFPVLYDPDFLDEDIRISFVAYLADCFDAFLFLPGMLLDKNLNQLIDMDGTQSPDCSFPTYLSELGTLQSSPGNSEEADNEGEEPTPPSAKRVAARMLVLTALAGRASMEIMHKEGQDISDFVMSYATLIQELGLEGELEDRERKVLYASAGELSERDVIDMCWRTEGAAMLAWSLGLHKLASYQTGTTTEELLTLLSIPNAEQAEGFLANATLRPVEELVAMQKQQLACHWRIRDFSINPTPTDFRAFDEISWFGPVDLSWAQFGPDNDLLIDGKSISKAKPEAVGLVSSITMERHHAINWLSGYSEVYSETDTPT